MKINNLLLILILITILCQVYSQDYDLIVRSNGDSIVCQIDSITDTHIYFKMMKKGYWRYTYNNKTDVIEFKHNVINKNTFVFRPGTSIIYKKVKYPRPKHNIYNNLFGDASIISINYERLFFITSNFFITGKLGIGYNEERNPPYESCGLSGLFNGCPLLRPPYKYLTIPHHITGNFGKGSTFIEFGLGGTKIDGKTNQKYILYPIIGLRIQPKYFWRVNLRIFFHTPNIEAEDIYFRPIGFSIGVSL